MLNPMIITLLAFLLKSVHCLGLSTHSSPPTMRPSFLSSALTAASLATCISAKAIFAHYMIAGATEDHIHTDIDNAITMGLDGFSINIGDPTPSWISSALDTLFGYAESRGFKLQISLDMYASGASCAAGGASCNGAYDYTPLLKGKLGSSAYCLGPNGLAFITTFSSGGFNDTH